MTTPATPMAAVMKAAVPKTSPAKAAVAEASVVAAKAAAVEMTAAAAAVPGFRCSGKCDNGQSRDCGGRCLFEFRHFPMSSERGVPLHQEQRSQDRSSRTRKKAPAPEDIGAEAFHGIIKAMMPAKG
jgi:hypothetical protein